MTLCSYISKGIRNKRNLGEKTNRIIAIIVCALSGYFCLYKLSMKS